MRTVFFRLLDADDKAAALREATQDPRADVRVELDTAGFAAVPGSPFAYWVPVAIRDAFSRYSPLKNAHRFAARGPYTLDDFRFVRLAHEIDASQIRNKRSDTVGKRAWVRFLKGGAFSRYYSDPYLVLDWSAEGAALKALVSAYRDSKGWGPNWTAAINGYEYYFLPGLTWTHRTTRKLSMRAMPAGCIFSAKGPALIVENEFDRIALLGLCNSKIFQATFEVSLGAADAAARSYDVGIMQRLPIPSLDDNSAQVLRELARTSWSKCRNISSTASTSCAFSVPALLRAVGDALAERAKNWAEYVCTLEAELGAIQAKIDEHSFNLYGIDTSDRLSITEGFGGKAALLDPSSNAEVPEDGDAEDAEEIEFSTDAAGLAAELVSWAVGVVYGRFDIRMATGARLIPAEPEPFELLPACSPGMLTGADALPLARLPSGYPLAFPESGVLVDDIGHAQDLTVAVRAVFDLIFGVDADRWWDDVAVLLDPKGHDVRAWLANSFFEYHIKHYSKSRRKAPLFWQLGVPSGHYSVWLYAHRITSDSFFQLQNEVVGPKLSHEERQLTSLIQTSGSSPSAQERKEIAVQEAVVKDLRAMLDEIKCVAPLWNPNLDDGVVLTMAPLWRLVPQHKPWQKELKSRWDELADGKYDWAHVAMHLWPERVVAKCAIDRSLAIAHGLESEFWIESVDGKWKPRPNPLKSADELVGALSSPAVKAALKSLLDAPTASGSRRAQAHRADSPAATKRGSH
jgi:hypothetical protein